MIGSVALERFGAANSMPQQERRQTATVTPKIRRKGHPLRLAITFTHATLLKPESKRERPFPMVGKSAAIRRSGVSGREGGFEPTTSRTGSTWHTTNYATPASYVLEFYWRCFEGSGGSGRIISKRSLTPSSFIGAWPRSISFARSGESFVRVGFS